MIKGHIRSIIRRIKFNLKHLKSNQMNQTTTTNKTQMTRAMGVLVAFEKHNGGQKPKEPKKLINTEYNNYTENCYYCNEEPLTFELWSTEIIKEAIN